MVTRSVAAKRSSESIKQHRSMSEQEDWVMVFMKSVGLIIQVCNLPELRRLNPFAVLPKDNKRLSGSIVRMSLSSNFLTSSFTASSSGVGRSWITKSNRHWERSATKRCLEACLRWRGGAIDACMGSR